MKNLRVACAALQLSVGASALVLLAGCSEHQANVDEPDAAQEQPKPGSMLDASATTTGDTDSTASDAGRTTGDADSTKGDSGPTPGPGQAPAGAYEACSGDPLPELTLTTVLSGLDKPIQALTPRNDAQTMFVVERGQGDGSGTGALKRFDLREDNPSATDLLSLNVSLGGEMGFLGAALHPNFDGMSETRIYLSFNPSPGSESLLAEYSVEGDEAVFQQDIFEVNQPRSNHNGGGVVFAPDGTLYFGLGDGGGSNDPHGDNGNGQNPNTPLGSLLRFDVDDIDTPPEGNLTSGDVGGASVDARIMHYGLRNPWRFSFDRLTGDLYIGDVGQNTREEVDVLPAGSGPTNFGWAAREGFGECPGCSAVLLEGTSAYDPVYDYATKWSGSGNGSVTGGYVYRGSKIPGLWGRYLFGDYVRGEIYALTYDGEGGACDVIAEAIAGLELPGSAFVSFAEDGDGELYLVNAARGSIQRIDPAP